MDSDSNSRVRLPPCHDLIRYRDLQLWLNQENLHSAAALVEKGDFKACKDLSEGSSHSLAGKLVYNARIPMFESENIPPSPSESRQEVRPRPVCSLIFHPWKPRARSKVKRSSYSPTTTHPSRDIVICNGASGPSMSCDGISCALSLDVVIPPPKNTTWISMRRPTPLGGIGKI